MQLAKKCLCDTKDILLLYLQSFFAEICINILVILSKMEEKFSSSARTVMYVIVIYFKSVSYLINFLTQIKILLSTKFR